MAQISSLFVTRLYRAALSDHAPAIDASELETSCIVIAEDDEAGQDWCAANGYPGYTSYASLTDLPWRFPIFADLVKVLDAHVAAFVEDLEFSSATASWCWRICGSTSCPRAARIRRTSTRIR